MSKSDISLHDVAEMLDVHYMTVYRYVRQGQLPATKVGRSWFVKSSDLKAFRDAKVHTAEVSEGGRKIAPWAERLEAQLILGDQRGATEIMEAVLRSGHDLYFLYLHVLTPAMSAIGARWAAGNLEIFVEHRASNIAMRLIGQFGPRFARRGVSKGTVVLGSPASEMHTLSTSMVADLIRFEGCDLRAVQPGDLRCRQGRHLGAGDRGQPRAGERRDFARRQGGNLRRGQCRDLRWNEGVELRGIEFRNLYWRQAADGRR